MRIISILPLLLAQPLSSAAFATGARRFATATSFVLPRSLSSFTALYGYTEGSDAVRAALEASKKYGLTSKEAQSAWDIVGEVLEDTEEEGDDRVPQTEDDIYQQKLSGLTVLIEDQKTEIDRLSTAAREIKTLKEAKAKTKNQQFAIEMDLPETYSDWEAIGGGGGGVETTDGQSEEMTDEEDGWDTAEECLLDAIEECEALEEMRGRLEVEKSG